MSTTVDTTRSRKEWSSFSSRYASTIGVVTQKCCRLLVSSANETIPFSESSYVLDHGAGTGTLTFALITQHPTVSVLATDIAPAMVAAIEEQKWPKVTARVLDACVLNNVAGLGPDNTFSHVLSTFVVQFTPGPENIVREMYRVLQPGGFFGLTLWGEKIGPAMVWKDTCQMVDPSYCIPPWLFDPSEWRTPEQVESVLKAVGFKDIKCEVLTEAFELGWTVEEYLDFWYAPATHPMAIRLIADFGERSEGEEVKEAMRKVLKERYDDAKGVTADCVLVTARK